MTTRKPTFFFLGAPKCGTTSFAKYLSEHPQIRVSSPKEPHYFCKDLNAGGLPIASDQEYLETFFPGIDNYREKEIGDCSVWYLFSDVALAEILKFQPTAKFFIIIRNPVEMAYSLHSMLNFQDQEDQADFKRAWGLQSVRRHGRAIPHGLWLDDKILMYKDVCSLGSQLEKVFSLVDRSRVHVILQDELRCDPVTVYKKALEFLEVEYDGRKEFPKENVGRRVNNRLVFLLLRTPYARWIANAIKHLLNLRSLHFGRPDFPMTEAVRSLLIDEFECEIAAMERLLETDLSRWRKMSDYKHAKPS